MVKYDIIDEIGDIFDVSCDAVKVIDCDLHIILSLVKWVKLGAHVDYPRYFCRILFFWETGKVDFRLDLDHLVRILRCG